MIFGSSLYGQKLYGAGNAATTVYSTDPVVFDGFSLSDGSTMILTRLIDSGPTRELTETPIPRGDGRYIIGDYKRDRIIECRGIVKQDSAANLDAYLDTIRKSLRGLEGNLDITDFNGTAKRFLATLTNYEELFADRRHYHRDFCPWYARFKCVTPFGRSREYQSISQVISSSPTNVVVTHAGTVRAKPVFVVIFDSATSVTAASAKNTTTGEQITYTGSLTAGDVLIFDSEDKKVTLNGTEVDFTGKFPELDVGTNVIQFSVTGSSFSVYSTAKHKTTYL